MWKHARVVVKITSCGFTQHGRVWEQTRLMFLVDVLIPLMAVLPAARVISSRHMLTAEEGWDRDCLDKAKNVLLQS